MKIKRLILFALIITFSHLESQEKTVKEDDLVEYWRKELSRFNYSLPEQFEVTFKKFNFKRGGGFAPQCAEKCERGN